MPHGVETRPTLVCFKLFCPPTASQEEPLCRNTPQRAELLVVHHFRHKTMGGSLRFVYLPDLAVRDFL
ncbi:unnamed protein product [Arctogadus glacialis]